MKLERNIKYHSNKHLFYRDEDGEIDYFRLDYGYHNGPQCMECGTSFCKHCHPERLDEECRVGFYFCGNCHKLVESDYVFCPYCGEKFDESKEEEGQ